MNTLLLTTCIIINVIEAAKILTVIPTPSLSHQVVFRPLTQELVKRGHEVTIITTDPVFSNGQSPENLTEIGLHDLSYGYWREFILNGNMTSGKNGDIITQMKTFLQVVSEIFERQFMSDEIQGFLKSKPKFDLLILEACSRPALIFSHLFSKVPVVLASSFGGVMSNWDVIGAPSRPPLLYPTMMRQRLFNLSLWEKIMELYNNYLFEDVFNKSVEKDSEMLKRLSGEDTPTIAELENNVDLLMLNVHPIWDLNRPVPPSVVYMGGIHQKLAKELPKDLKLYLDSSRYGVIYISYGTNVSPSMLPSEKIQILVKVLSQLPYDVLWKWDKDELPGQSKNIRISKWLPQSDLLKHPKLKLFITQGGLQSTDEAINAGVPLIGMPMLADQWYNVEQYVYHKIGVRLDMESLTEGVLKTAINNVLNDDSYRKNIERLRSLMRDQPESGLQRAVWWTEHVLRHGGARHLRAPAANISWAQYLDLQLLAALAVAGVTAVAVALVLLYLVISFVKKSLFGSEKFKSD